MINKYIVLYLGKEGVYPGERLLQSGNTGKLNPVSYCGNFVKYNSRQEAIEAANAAALGNTYGATDYVVAQVTDTVTKVVVTDTFTETVSVG